VFLKAWRNACLQVFELGSEINKIGLPKNFSEGTFLDKTAFLAHFTSFFATHL